MRFFVGRLLVSAGMALLVSCGGDILGPEELVGDYELVAVNSAPLPHADDLINGGRVFVRSDGTIQWSVGGLMPGSGPRSPWADHGDASWEGTRSGLRISGTAIQEMTLHGDSLSGSYSSDMVGRVRLTYRRM